MSKVLVTGGAGFIGSHVVDQLIVEGHEVVVIDNFETGKRNNIKTNVNIFDIDINSKIVKSIFEYFLPEYVIHLAAQTSVSTSIGFPKKDAQTNIIGTLNILELSKEYQVKKIIFTSSAAVYGENGNLPILESYPLSPFSPYGLSKLTGEKYIKLYNKLHKLNYSILRLSNVYGPRQCENGEAGVVTKFINQMIKGITPTIEGDGNQSRDFIFVKDVANALVRAIVPSDPHILNISSGTSISINCLYDFLAKLIEYNKPANFGPSRVGDIYESSLSNENAKRILQWLPAISIEEGLNETVSYFLASQ
ncbi:NAD-dependent epimerase/dehydratase family protein [Lysinibacillus telephonicus]|uniref:NAD-dependent epimerase/dehydratase family protein n=1 Tax=Lysinibacillus telephonicus TaxID=1714840 RepID=UPI0031FD235C